jgi:hypothetical protein
VAQGAGRTQGARRAGGGWPFSTLTWFW